MIPSLCIKKMKKKIFESLSSPMQCFEKFYIKFFMQARSLTEHAIIFRIILIKFHW